MSTPKVAPRHSCRTHRRAETKELSKQTISNYFAEMEAQKHLETPHDADQYVPPKEEARAHTPAFLTAAKNDMWDHAMEVMVKGTTLAKHIHDQDESGCTVFHYVVTTTALSMEARLEIMGFLLERGASCFKRNHGKKSPLSLILQKLKESMDWNDALWLVLGYTYDADFNTRPKLLAKVTKALSRSERRLSEETQPGEAKGDTRTSTEELTTIEPTTAQTSSTPTLPPVPAAGTLTPVPTADFAPAPESLPALIRRPKPTPKAAEETPIPSHRLS